MALGRLSVFAELTVLMYQASALGSSLADRLRINAVHALRGMSITRKGQEDEPAAAFIGDMRSRVTRLHIQVYIWAMRAGFWVSEAIMSTWGTVRVAVSWLSPFGRRQSAL